jgi:hypothetical protein
MGDWGMFRNPVKTTEIEVNGRSYALLYFEQQTARGASRYSCEVLLEAGDRIILDDDSMPSLEWKVTRLVPATVYSRVLAARSPKAA